MYNAVSLWQAIKRGYMRLQALFQSRVLTQRFVNTRNLVCRFQRYARGHIARKRARNRHRSIVKIQAGFRKILAQRQVRRMKLEV